MVLRRSVRHASGTATKPPPVETYRPISTIQKVFPKQIGSHLKRADLVTYYGLNSAKLNLLISIFAGPKSQRMIQTVLVAGLCKSAPKANSEV